MRQKLYSWQEECLDLWQKAGGRGIVRAVTGSGKTTLAIAAAERMRMRYGEHLKVKIVVPQTALASQWAQALRDNGAFSRSDIGFYYGGRKEKTERLFMIYVVNSARYSLARHILTDLAAGDNVLLIADECHHYASAENRKIFEFLPYLSNFTARYMALGLSATPEAEGYEEVLLPALGKEIYRYSFEDAARHRTIAPFAILNLSLTFSPEEDEKYGELSDTIVSLTAWILRKVPSLKGLDGMSFYRALRHIALEDEGSDLSRRAGMLLNATYARKDVVNEAAARICALLCLMRQLDSSAKILIFCERIRQAEEVCRQLNAQYRGQVGLYHSKLDTPARLATLTRYKNGEIRILVTCRALDEGLDVPETSVGIVLSGGQTKRQRIQRLGRILRRGKGDRMAALYYFYVSGTTDPCTYMEDFTQAPVETLFLSYESAEDRFVNPYYEEVAASALSDLILKGAERDAQREFRRCVMQGLCRTDWLLSEEEMDARAKGSGSVREKNYWVTMKLLRRADERAKSERAAEETDPPE